MKYIHVPEVLPEIAAKSKSDIESVNKYMDDVHGTVVTIQRIRSGQARPYADSVSEALISCHQPNMYTTNGPILRVITREQAMALARIFVGEWSDEPVFLETRLESLTPEANPFGMEEPKDFKQPPGEERSSAWRVVIRSPYND